MNTFNGKKYLITGGTGFIGRALVIALLEKGALVRSLDNDSRGAKEKFGEYKDQIEILTGDIRDLQTVVNAVKGVDAVCHLAYINGTQYFYTKPELILEVATKGMLNVLDACIEGNVNELVLASSSEVYQTPALIPTNETVSLIVPNVLNPRFSYGGGKIISELLAINYGRSFFKKVIIFRPHNVYGPDMGREHVIPEFILKFKDLIIDSKSIYDFPIQGTGDETRSFIYINDFIDALMCVIDKGEHLNIYHIGTEIEVSIGNLAKLISKILKKNINLMPSQLLEGSTIRRCPDVSKIKQLGFSPKISLEYGIKITTEWYMK